MSRVVKDISELKGEDLDVVVDFAGFGNTTVGAFDAVKDGGKVVLVGLGKTTFNFESFGFITRAITLQGSTPVGNPQQLKNVLEMIDSGQLEIVSSNVGFNDIPKGLKNLANGGVSGRLVARYDQ